MRYGIQSSVRATIGYHYRWWGGRYVKSCQNPVDPGWNSADCRCCFDGAAPNEPAFRIIAALPRYADFIGSWAVAVSLWPHGFQQIDGMQLSKLKNLPFHSTI